jgi:hypothetical protein
MASHIMILELRQYLISLSVTIRHFYKHLGIEPTLELFEIVDTAELFAKKYTEIDKPVFLKINKRFSNSMFIRENDEPYGNFLAYDKKLQGAESITVLCKFTELIDFKRSPYIFNYEYAQFEILDEHNTKIGKYILIEVDILADFFTTTDCC